MGLAQGKHFKMDAVFDENISIELLEIAILKDVYRFSDITLITHVSICESFKLRGVQKIYNLTYLILVGRNLNRQYRLDNLQMQSRLMVTIRKIITHKKDQSFKTPCT